MFLSYSQSKNPKNETITVVIYFFLIEDIPLILTIVYI